MQWEKWKKISRKGMLLIMIIKVKEGFRVVAESGRNMGTYPTREQAEKRLRQIEMFKHMRKK